MGLACMYSPLLRSGCLPCDKAKAPCSYAFRDKSNHPLATYLGYAFHRMITSPDVYAEPDFSPPNQWPNPLPDPDDYAWFREQYKAVPRGRSERSKAELAALIAAEHSLSPEPTLEDAEEGTEGSSADAAPPVCPHGKRSDTSTPTMRRSRSNSGGPSKSSSTFVPSSVVPVDEPPLSPSAATIASNDGKSDSEEPHDRISRRSPLSVTSQEPEASASTSPLQTLDERTALPDVGYVSPIPSGDAMDTQPDFADDGPTPISLPPNIQPIKSSKMPDELSRHSSSRLRPSDLPPALAGATKPSKKDLTVLSINGNEVYVIYWHYVVLTIVGAESWRHLPRLGKRLADGTYALVGPPHHIAERHGILRQLANVDRGGLEILNTLSASHAPPLAEAPSRPQTPDRQVFTFNDNIVRLAQDTKAKFDEIGKLERQVEDNISVLKDRARDFVGDYQHAHEQAAVAAGGVQAGDIAGADAILMEAVRDAFFAMSHIHDIIRRLASVFPSIPAVPWNWTALLDLLSRVEDLRNLYRVSWERFAALEEDVRPVRSEVLCIRQNVAQIQAQLDGIANETIDVCRPLLNTVHNHLSTRIASLDIRLSQIDGSAPTTIHPAPASIGDVLRVLTALSERVDNLERAAGDSLSLRVEAEITRYFSNLGLREDILRQLGQDWVDPPRWGPAGGSISDALGAAYDPPTTGGSIPEPADATQRMKTPLERMDEGKDMTSVSHASAPPQRPRRLNTVRRATASLSGVAGNR